MEMSDNPVPQITGINLLPDGIEIGYIRYPQDIRKNGLIWQHQVLVPFGSDYEDEIEAFTEAVQALLTDALDDEDRAEPIDPECEDDEEEEEDE